MNVSFFTEPNMTSECIILCITIIDSTIYCTATQPPVDTHTGNIVPAVSFMSQLNHAHVVRLLGVCTLEEPLSMIFEFMDLGDLCSFLRDAVVLGEDGAYTMLTIIYLN